MLDTPPSRGLTLPLRMYRRGHGRSTKFSVTLGAYGEGDGHWRA